MLQHTIPAARSIIANRQTTQSYTEHTPTPPLAQEPNFPRALSGGWEVWLGQVQWSRAGFEKED